MNMKFNFKIPAWLWVLINLLQIVFVILKLFNVITWSWLWVVSPLLIVMGLIYIGWIICSIIMFFKWIRK